MEHGDPEAEPRAGRGPVAGGARGHRLGVLQTAVGRLYGEGWDGGECCYGILTPSSPSLFSDVLASCRQDLFDV